MTHSPLVLVAALLVCAMSTGTAHAQSGEAGAAPASPPADAREPLAGPAIRIVPRPGNFFVPPSGRGHYSLVDHVRGRDRDGAPRSGYPAFAIMAPAFFDADFRYVDAILPAARQPFERLKRVRVGENLLVSTGGDAWYRFHDEAASRLTRTDQTYSLGHVRAYGDLTYRDRVRMYAEFVTAGRWGGSLPALPSDSDHADLLNAFADVRLFEAGTHPAYVRVGRQEMLLGSQRLISPLPWANVRRNFDGVRVFRQGARVDVDAFWLEPVQPNRTGFDTPSHDVQLAGAWFTYRPRGGHFIDAYYLFSNNSATVVQQGLDLAPAHASTVGSRYAGDRDEWLWDVEGALQLGRQEDGDAIAAGMASVGLGRHFPLRMSPTLWLYYDWASGDGSPNAGRVTTFNQLYPFGHYYLGWSDMAGRQNIRDANVHLALYPVSWLTVWLQYHQVWLDRSRDALYNAGGAAIRRAATGDAGTSVGGDADAVVNVHLDAQSDVLIAYARGGAGRFLETTATATAAPSGRALSVIYTVRW